jgi:hypothetical protein
VTSLIAIVPDSELSRPTLTLSPEVSAVTPPLVLSPVLAPHAAIAAVATTIAAHAIRWRGRTLNIEPPISGQGEPCENAEE